MATTFKDICTGRKYQKNGEEKMAWTKVGTLIEKDGKQYVKLEAYPLPNADGEVFLSVFEQRENQQRPSQTRQANPDFDASDPFSDKVTGGDDQHLPF